MEKILDIVKCYENGKTLLIAIPKISGVRPGGRFECRIDEKTGSLTYTPLEFLNREKEKSKS